MRAVRNTRRFLRRYSAHLIARILRASTLRKHPFSSAPTGSLFGPMPAGDWLPPAKYIRCGRRRKETHMLWTIFVILLVLWLLGLVSSYTLGGYIHILLLVAVIVLIFNLLSGRR